MQAFQYTQAQMDYFKGAFAFWYDRCMATTAKTLAVAVVNDDGKVTVITYSLNYDYNNGTYIAHRTYETNDAGSVAKKVVNAIKTVTNKVVSAIKGLFGFLKK